MEAALAVAKYRAENPQPPQPSSGGKRSVKEKRRKKNRDGFERETYEDIKKREEEEGFVSSGSDEGGEDVRVPMECDLLEVEVVEGDTTGWRTGKVLTLTPPPNPNPSPSPNP